MSDVYAVAAPKYREAGWVGVLPLPPGKKDPPPTGFTGYDGLDPTDADVNRWISDHPDANVGIRVPPGVIGYDADLYKPEGRKTHAALVAKCGELPPTWVSTSRTDGSGISFYRIPEGVKLRGAFGGIEIIQWHHRYAGVPPSVHPEGRPYRWTTPDGEPSEWGPRPDELPWLSDKWLEELREPEPTADGERPPRERSTDEWARCVRDVFAEGVAASGSRHDAATAAAMALIRFADQGYPGADDALEALGATFRARVADRATGAEAEGEWDRMVAGAWSKVRSTRSTIPRWEESAEHAQRARIAAGGGAADEEASAEDWPAPVPLTGPETGPPFDVNWLPRVIREHVIELARETQTPVDMAAFFDLGVLGAALAKKIRVHIFGRWHEPPTLYVCVVAEVGERKSAVHEAAVAPLEELEAGLTEKWEKVKAEKEKERRGAASKAEAAAIEVPPEPRLMGGDATMEALAPLMRDNGARIALITDEGASVFEILAGRYADRPSIELFLKGADGKGTARSDRVGRSVKVREPLLTCVLAVQPNVLTSVTSTMLGRGAPARFLYVVTATAKGHRDLRPQPMSQAVADAWSNLVKHFGGLETSGEVTIELSPEADDVFHEHRAWHEHESRPDGRLTLVGDWATKLPGAVARLALIMHVAERRPGSLAATPPVSGDAMRRAVAMGNDYLLRHAEVAYGCLDANPNIKLAKRIVGWLRRNPRERFQRRDACMATRKPVEEIVPALAVLVEHDVLRPVIDEKRHNQQLKDVTEYLVSPRLNELETDRAADEGASATSSTNSTDRGEDEASEPEGVEDVEHVAEAPPPAKSDAVEDVEHVEGGRGFAAWDGPEGDLTQNSENGAAGNGVPGDDETREKGFV